MPAEAVGLNLKLFAQPSGGTDGGQREEVELIGLQRGTIGDRRSGDAGLSGVNAFGEERGCGSCRGKGGALFQEISAG